MLETSVPVTVYLGLFLIRLFGISLLKWLTTVMIKCPEHKRNKVTDLLVEGTVPEALGGPELLLQVMPVFASSLANSLATTQYNCPDNKN